MNRFIAVILFCGLINCATAQAINNEKFVTKDSIITKSDSIPLEPDLFDINDSYDSIQFTGKIIRGIASYYSHKFEGRITSTGEIFGNNNLTGASNNLKLNTWVKVTNLKNGKFVIVRINDRMHPRMKKKGRVIDLSRFAAKKLDFMEAGLAKVKLEVILPPNRL
jgi:rare lipoprotein A (peptidoglycan hydrolase)